MGRGHTLLAVTIRQRTQSFLASHEHRPADRITIDVFTMSRRVGVTSEIGPLPIHRVLSDPSAGKPATLENAPGDWYPMPGGNAHPML